MLLCNHLSRDSSICRLLSPVVKYSSNKDHNRQRLTNLATNIAERYRDQAVSLTRDLGSTFHLLLDLCYFFDLYHSDKNEQALSVIGDLHILPANTDQVNFNLLSIRNKRFFL